MWTGLKMSLLSRFCLKMVCSTLIICIFSWDVLITMIRPSHGYRLVNKMSFSRDVSITMIRPSHGYRLVNEMSLLSTLSFKKGHTD